MTTTKLLEKWTSVETSKFADIQYNSSTQTALITTKAEYLPMDKFREIFESLSKLFNTQAVKTLVFDKQSLRVFHQPSMEWYYNEWKTVMLQKHGLRNHYKILPQDSLFRKSVEIGRSKILSSVAENSPLKQLNIRYFETVEEALKA